MTVTDGTSAAQVRAVRGPDLSDSQADSSGLQVLRADRFQRGKSGAASRPSKASEYFVLAVPVGEVLGHIRVLHDVTDVSADALIVEAEERKHIITLVAAQQLGQHRDSIGGDDVYPFVGGDVTAPEVTDPAVLAVTGDCLPGWARKDP